MHYQLPTLPYAQDALEPFLSAETLEYHHGKHHAKYVDTLNQLLQESPLKESSLDQIIQQADGPLYNNAGQTFNHDFYWKCLSPDATEPSGPLVEALANAFDNIEGFKEAFTKSAMTLFGSGWIWLAMDRNGKMMIQQGKDADSPVKKGEHPLLTLDMWEHAYYIDYRNGKADYIKTFWEYVNWDFVSENFTRKSEVVGS